MLLLKGGLADDVVLPEHIAEQLWLIVVVESAIVLSDVPVSACAICLALEGELGPA